MPATKLGSLKSLAVLCLLVLASAVALACGDDSGSTPTPAAQPPTATATSEPESADLAGTSWELATLGARDVLPGTSPSLEFGEDISLSGSDGCNQFTTTYTQIGDSLTVTQPVASTRIACEPDVTSQATAYMAALADTTAFVATETTLTLGDGNQTLATFTVGGGSGDSTLAGTSWTLSNLAGDTLVEGTEVTLQFGEGGDVSGSDGCNTYGGEYTEQGSSLTFEKLFSTQIACEDDIMAQATAYTAALTSTSAFELTGEELTLMDGDETVATLAASSSSSSGLAGTSWTLAELDGEAPVTGTSVTLQFGDDGSAGGSDGCNTYGTTFTETGSELTFGDNPISTQIACADDIMAQASAYMDALAEVTSFTMTADELALMNRRDTVATFAVSAQDLAGTSWTVTSYNNQADAVLSVIAGTEITAEFGDDGQVTGNASCNDYFAGYTAADGTISVEPAGATRMLCPEPPNLMDQETSFLEALESSVTYEIEGDQLTMRTSLDQISLVMTRN